MATPKAFEVRRVFVTIDEHSTDTDSRTLQNEDVPDPNYWRFEGFGVYTRDDDGCLRWLGDYPTLEEATAWKAKHAAAAAEPVAVLAPEVCWWVVTLRESGDDEDSLYVVEAVDERGAVDAAEAQLADDCGFEDRGNVCVECAHARGDAACGEACAYGCRPHEYPDQPEVFVNYVVRCPGGEPELVRGVQ